MKRVLSYLDCGCATFEDGTRSWCPTCANGGPAPCADCAAKDAEINRLRCLCKDVLRRDEKIHQQLTLEPKHTATEWILGMLRNSVATLLKAEAHKSNNAVTGSEARP